MRTYSVKFLHQVNQDVSVLVVPAMTPLVLASELPWGDRDVDDGNGDDNLDGDGGSNPGVEGDGLSPAARQPLSPMSEAEQQVREQTSCSRSSHVSPVIEMEFVESRVN